MEIIESNSTLPYIINARPIGIGTTAICFLENGIVFKRFIDNSNTRWLLKNENIINKFERISDASNKSFVGPTKLLLVDGKVAGYFYPYIVGKTFKHIHNVTINELFDSYKMLKDDIVSISSKSFCLGDIHERNIIYNNGYSIIDLDRGRFKDVDTDKLIKVNSKNMFNAIIWHIFNADPCEFIIFEDKELNDAIYNVSAYDMNNIDDLLKLILDRCEDDNPKINKVRKKISHHNCYNSYYTGMR